MQARYTEVLYNLLKNDRTKQLIDNAMSTYPLYTSTSERIYGIPNIVPTREELNKKILNYYKYREIGFETVGRFLDELEISLNEIMPYYNQLFFSADQDYNIIYNVDYQRTINRDLEGNIENNQTSDTSMESKTEDTNTNSTTTNDTTTTTGQTENYNKNVKSDTPQNQLSITNRQIDSVDYANEVSWNKDNASNSGTSTGTATSSGTTTSEATTEGSTISLTKDTTENAENERTIETTKGNFGVVSAQDLIRKYREIIINIEQQIINDPRITELFMLVY